MFDIKTWTPEERDVLAGWDDLAANGYATGNLVRAEITDLEVNSDGVVGLLIKDARNFHKGSFGMTAKLVKTTTPKEGQCAFTNLHPKAEQLFKDLAAFNREARKAQRAANQDDE